MPFVSQSLTALFPVLKPGDAVRERDLAIQREVIELFDALRAPLLRYAMSFGVGLHDGEDVVQEAFLALFQHLRQDGDRTSLHGWLFRVTHNLSLKRREKSLRFESIEPEKAANWSDKLPDPEDQLLFNELQMHLLAGLRAMSDVDRRCILLRAEGMRYREIAQVLGISLGSVAASITRSLNRLARIEERRS